jgi:23S rRNA pseudouridine2605 synthase
MLAKLNHKVMKLRRIGIGPIKLDKLPKGKARRVNAVELEGLKKFVASAQEKIEKARLRAASKPPKEKME